MKNNMGKCKRVKCADNACTANSSTFAATANTATLANTALSLGPALVRSAGSTTDTTLVTSNRVNDSPVVNTRFILDNVNRIAHVWLSLTGNNTTTSGGGRNTLTVSTTGDLSLLPLPPASWLTSQSSSNSNFSFPISFANVGTSVEAEFGNLSALGANSFSITSTDSIAYNNGDAINITGYIAYPF